VDGAEEEKRGTNTGFRQIQMKNMPYCWLRLVGNSGVRRRVGDSDEKDTSDEGFRTWEFVN